VVEPAGVLGLRGVKGVCERVGWAVVTLLVDAVGSGGKGLSARGMGEELDLWRLPDDDIGVGIVDERDSDRGVKLLYE
jgi:hypothetical protein